MTKLIYKQPGLGDIISSWSQQQVHQPTHATIYFYAAEEKTLNFKSYQQGEVTESSGGPTSICINLDSYGTNLRSDLHLDLTELLLVGRHYNKSNHFKTWDFSMQQWSFKEYIYVSGCNELRNLRRRRSTPSVRPTMTSEKPTVKLIKH